MKTLIFFVNIFLLHTAVFSQATLTDTLEAKLKGSADDTTKVNLLNDMVSKYQHVNPERAMTLAVQSADLANHIKFDFGLGAAYRLTGLLYVDKNDFDKAAQYY